MNGVQARQERSEIHKMVVSSLGKHHTPAYLYSFSRSDFLCLLATRTQKTSPMLWTITLKDMFTMPPLTILEAMSDGYVLIFHTALIFSYTYIFQESSIGDSACRRAYYRTGPKSLQSSKLLFLRTMFCYGVYSL